LIDELLAIRGFMIAGFEHQDPIAMTVAAEKLEILIELITKKDIDDLLSEQRLLFGQIEKDEENE
jgi:hypothetical protein